jgi:hypothetical protein
MKSFDAVALSRLKILLCIILQTHTGCWDNVVSIENGLRAGQLVSGKNLGTRFHLFKIAQTVTEAHPPSYATCTWSC